MTRLLLVFVAAVAFAASAVASADAIFPKRIDLPDGFEPEGIATAGEQFYVGSIPTVRCTAARRTIATYQLSSGGSFVNDVVVTARTAWFTDSFKAVLYRVPLRENGRPGPRSGVETVALTGEYVHQAGFNVNGIDAAPDGTLVIVQSSTETLSPLRLRA